MAVLRVFKGSILEENIARTAGSIGESVAAGAIFTCRRSSWRRRGRSFDSPDAYWKSTALMLVGSVLGVLFVSLIRRVMVEDPELPFPESVAAAEIHKAGQRGAKAAKYLFYNIGFGAVVFLRGRVQLFAPDQDFFFHIGRSGHERAAARPARLHAIRCQPAASPRSPRPPSARRISASATSSDRSWRRSISPAACSRGAC